MPYRHYLINNTYVKMTAITADNISYCDMGISNEWYIPNRFWFVIQYFILIKLNRKKYI